jgi:CRP-like cAMP-binding protein
MNAEQFLWAYVAKEETYPEGATVIEEGSRGNWVYVILEGRAKVVKRASTGMLTLSTLKEGDVFGEMGLFERGEGIRSASVVAADGPVRVGVLDEQLLARDYEAVSQPLRELLKTLMISLRRATEKVCTMGSASN